MNREGMKISDAELEVMKVLWEGEGPMSYPEIYRQLAGERQWARNTVKTLIARLVDKGVLEKQAGEVFRYRPLVEKSAFTREKTRSFLNQVFGGSAKKLFSALLEGEIISGEDMRELEEFWRKGRDNDA